MNARRVSRMLFALGVAAGALSALASCVLAEPPAALPDPSSDRPIILHSSVDPPASSILEAWPTQGFYVPVEVPNPNLAVKWRLFIDYDPVVSKDYTQGQLDPGQTDGGVRPIFTEPPQPVLEECHTVELIVAYAFDSDHAPDFRGGDAVSWFYAPSGSLDTCPIYSPIVPEGGLDDAPSDGDAPSADGADE